MFIFYSTVNAIYLLHKETGKYLGIGSHENRSNSVVMPVKSISEAENFKIRESGISVTDYSENNFSKNAPKDTKIRIMESSGKRSFDAASGKIRDGNLLILYDTHENIAQKMSIKLLADMSYALEWEGKCFRYKNSDNSFYTGSCDNISNDSFEIYFDERTPDILNDNHKIVEREIFKREIIPLPNHDYTIENPDAIEYRHDDDFILRSPKYKIRKIYGTDLEAASNYRVDADSIHAYNEIMKEKELMENHDDFHSRNESEDKENPRKRKSKYESEDKENPRKRKSKYESEDKENPNKRNSKYEGRKRKREHINHGDSLDEDSHLSDYLKHQKKFHHYESTSARKPLLRTFI